VHSAGPLAGLLCAIWALFRQRFELVHQPSLFVPGKVTSVKVASDYPILFSLFVLVRLVRSLFFLIIYAR